MIDNRTRFSASFDLGNDLGITVWKSKVRNCYEVLRNSDSKGSTKFTGRKKVTKQIIDVMNKNFTEKFTEDKPCTMKNIDWRDEYEVWVWYD